MTHSDVQELIELLDRMGETFKRMEAILAKYDSVPKNQKRRKHESESRAIANTSERIHRVRSSDGKGWYKIRQRGDYMNCECKGFFYRGDCRHVKLIRNKIAVEQGGVNAYQIS